MQDKTNPQVVTKEEDSSKSDEDSLDGEEGDEMFDAPTESNKVAASASSAAVPLKSGALAGNHTIKGHANNGSNNNNPNKKDLVSPPAEANEKKKIHKWKLGQLLAESRSVKFYGALNLETGTPIAAKQLVFSGLSNSEGEERSLPLPIEGLLLHVTTTILLKPHIPNSHSTPVTTHSGRAGEAASVPQAPVESLHRALQQLRVESQRVASVPAR
jgi:hypothetical protein